MDFKAPRENGGLFPFLTSQTIKTKKNIFIFLSLFAQLIVFCSCKVKEIKKQEMAEEQCAFITIKASRDSIADKTTFRITNINVVNSKIRYVVDENKKREPNFLHITINYKNGKVIEANTEHPLFKRLDLYSESGKIEAKSISLSQGELFLRVPYFGKYKSIQIAETINFKERPIVVIKEND
ncbi:MAG: hypothetical protein JNL60_10420 [Bacteroidia bacterium]|nr:hypothetical protein [Bacteroidia bacterium]